jgi:transcriptional regulator with XRE-family HTH domain
MSKYKRDKASYNLVIGNNIRRWRELKGIKQEQLAGDIGITKAALSNIENNKADINLHRIEDIAKCLDIDVMNLFKNPLDLLPTPTSKT